MVAEQYIIKNFQVSKNLHTEKANTELPPLEMEMNLISNVYLRHRLSVYTNVCRAGIIGKEKRRMIDILINNDFDIYSVSVYVCRRFIHIECETSLKFKKKNWL